MTAADESAERGRAAEESSVEATADELAVLVGPGDVNRKAIEGALGVRLVVGGGRIVVSGGEHAARAVALLEGLLGAIRAGEELSAGEVRRRALLARRDGAEGLAQAAGAPIVATARGRPIAPKTPGQAAYVAAITAHDLTFCIGPAGTGKTYLAMATAVAALRAGSVSRIVLTRPIVEAGEALGFLPGDIMEKVDPYLRPLHDALHDIMGGDRFRRNLDRATIEVIPLAYMRGRTLNEAFIVLDEAQNTTPGQMKMALTRLGFGAKMVVTGDVTQTDLPRGQASGLNHAIEVLESMKGIAVCRLGGADIVRHDLVQRIVAAYEERERKAGQADVEA